MKRNKIVVIGTGSFATAISKILFDGGNKNIILYGKDPQELQDLKEGKNTKHFPGVEVPKFNTTNNLEEALVNASIIVLAVPSVVMDIVFSDVLKNLNSEVMIVNGSKGFYPNSNDSLHSGLLKAAKGSKLIRGVVSLSGPSHAEEMVLARPTVVAVVSEDINLAKEAQEVFNNNYFRIYSQIDVIGAEVGASYKNVLAIASGMASGLGLGINTIAALLTRGIAEMARFNKLLGGKEKTIYGLTGVGDLIVTATSDLSRNFQFGKAFAKEGKKALSTNKTVEGLAALSHIKEIADKNKLELPIVNSLASIIKNDLNLQDQLTNLFNRELKSE